MNRKIELPLQYRALSLEGPPSEEGVFRASLSSELPVEVRNNQTGEQLVEVLEHSREAIDLSRAQKGLPILLDHDKSQVVGRAHNLTIGEDRRLYADLKFSRSASGQEVARDVQDGIRQEISIGYRPQKMVRQKSDSALPLYRTTQWMPYEVTLTAIPADASVGVGRSAERAAFSVTMEDPDQSAPPAEERIMAQETTPAPAPEPVRANVHDDSAVRREMAEINDLCAAAEQPVGRAAQFIRDGKSVNEVKGILFDEAVKKAKSGPKLSPDMSEGEKKRYSFSRGLLAAGGLIPWEQAGLEREVSDEIAKRLNKEGATSLFIPNDLEVRALGSAVAGTGAEFKFTQPKPFIELLREKLVCRALGATVLSGLAGPIAFPRQTVAGAASARTEVPGSDLSDTDSTYDTLAMSPKTVQRNTAVSRQLLFQASEDVENLIRSDLAAVLALAMDSFALNGGGSNQPTGLLSNTSITTVTLGAQGGTITYAALVNLEKTVAQGNADIGRLAVVTNAQQRAQARQVQQFSGTNGVPLWVGGANGTEAMAVGEILGPNGYPAYVSQQIPSNLTKGTQTTICSAWIFGNWKELIIGEWGAMEFIVDPYSKKKQALLEIEAILYGDVGVRHTASFAKIQDAL